MADRTEEPLWLRNVAISPDASTIAFTYKGNIYTVPAAGGDARQITSGSSYNTTPIWSPDGSRIAFASDREGSMDIYVVDSRGGVPQRITTNSAAETPLTFSGDSTIIYSSSIQPSREAAQGGFLPQTYSVATRPGSRPRLLNSVAMAQATADPTGRILYQDKKGFENSYRKHERSSSTGDIWLLDDGKFRRLTDFVGNDQNPVWGQGDTFFYVSERDGDALNVYETSVDGAQPRKLTDYKIHPVRSLSASAGGKMLAYSYDGRIWTLVPGAEPRQVKVNIVADDYVRAPQRTDSRFGVGSFSVSPDGETVAFILDGDVYLTSVEYETTRRVTDTPGQEREVDFAPDGRSIVYDSERDGIWQLFTTTIKDPEEKSMLYATELVEEPLYKSDRPAFQPAYSPDGKKVAFLEGRTELRVIDLKSKQVTTTLDGKYNYSYQDGDVSFSWSPDSRWLLCDYIGIGGWNNSDIAAVRADGSEVIDLTESGYSDSGADWAMDGKAVVWTTGKYGYKSHGSWGNQTDVMAMFLDGDAYDRFNMTEEELDLLEKAEKDKDQADEPAKDKKDAKKSKKSKKDKSKKAKEEDAVKPLSLDFENRRYRTARLTGSSSMVGAYFLSPKGDKLYYTSSSPDGRALYERDLREGSTRVLAKGLSAWGFEPDKKGKTLYFNSGRGLKKIDLASGKQEDIDFNAEITRDPEQRRQYMFDHMWRQVLDKFYVKDLGGVDWQMYKKEYEKFLPHINNNQDFAILQSEILGELNASHTGSRCYSNSGVSFRPTAMLGAFFDETFDGDGLKISEVIRRGPLAKANVNLRPGDVITAIDTREIKAGQDYYPLLEGKAGKKVRLDVRKASGKDSIVYVRPISAGTNSDLLYQRWVQRNEAIVDSVSGGRVGYVHVRSMDGESFNEVYDRLLGKYRNCDAVVVDTRFNGGGWLHNDLALLLSGKEYVRFAPRGQYIGSEPFSQWTKPSVMLVNESNYSDAHGAPFVYQTLGIGDVVGAPVPGTMTAVWWEYQIDPSVLFGIPQVASYDMKGNVLENQQLTPDVVIYNNPEHELSGQDDQLIGSVRHLLGKIKDNR